MWAALYAGLKAGCWLFGAAVPIVFLLMGMVVLGAILKAFRLTMERQAREGPKVSVPAPRLQREDPGPGPG